MCDVLLIPALEYKKNSKLTCCWYYTIIQCDKYGKRGNSQGAMRNRVETPKTDVNWGRAASWKTYYSLIAKSYGASLKSACWSIPLFMNTLIMILPSIYFLGIIQLLS